MSDEHSRKVPRRTPDQVGGCRSAAHLDSFLFRVLEGDRATSPLEHVAISRIQLTPQEMLPCPCT